jgi:predicted carbohydrate-binding protein with CBM5 and CBM33 domain
MNTTRRAAAAVASLMALGTAALVTADPASAHGVSMVAGSRTYLCYIDGLTDTGEIRPDNPACADAVAQGGTQPLYDWFGVLRSEGGGRTEGFVPDGQICGGGTEKYAAYNMARADWPVTHLTAGATIQWRYSNWAAHPGRFDMYVTREGWSPTQPLAWGDLERFASVTDPPQSGGPGGPNYYFWDVELPQRTGQHIIFVHWIRSDSEENFYSCSDVVFDGGNGEVTGVNGELPAGTPAGQPGGGQEPEAPETPPTSQAPAAPETPSTTQAPAGAGQAPAAGDRDGSFVRLVAALRNALDAVLGEQASC